MYLCNWNGGWIRIDSPFCPVRRRRARHSSQPRIARSQLKPRNHHGFFHHEHWAHGSRRVLSGGVPRCVFPLLIKTNTLNPGNLLPGTGAYVTLPSWRRSGHADDGDARFPLRTNAERDVLATGDDAGASSPRRSRLRRARPERHPAGRGVKFPPLARKRRKYQPDPR